MNRKELYLMVIAILVAIFIAFGTAPNIFAQDDFHKLEVFGGYSDFRLNGSGNEQGFNASITRNFSRYVGVKVDFAGNYRKYSALQGNPQTFIQSNNDKIYNYLGGIQIKDNSTEKRFKPFTHFLIGGASFRSNVSVTSTINNSIINSKSNFNSISLAIGGGLDIKLHKRIDLRVVQIDYIPTHFNSNWQEKNHRFSFGIVIH